MNVAPFLGITALLTAAPSAFAAAEPVGEAAGTYALPAEGIGSYGALLAAIERWCERNVAQLSREDLADLADWLNRNFDKLDRGT